MSALGGHQNHGFLAKGFPSLLQSLGHTESHRPQRSERFLHEKKL